MVKYTAYSTTVWSLDKHYEQIVAACHAQAISHIGILASVTGKLLGSPDHLRDYVQRLAQDGISTWAEVFGVGHPAMGEHYNPDGTPPVPAIHWHGDLVVENRESDTSLLPVGWQYAVNEFGNPVYCTSCANQACIDGNRWVMQQLTPIFDEVWYDDEFRLDGDQGAGVPYASTAACYCDHCMADLSQRLGRKVTRADVLADQNLHDAWMTQKTDQLAKMWRVICETGRAIKPQLRMGVMVRWGGEERDGVDIDKWLPSFGEKPLLRAGEGHFTRGEYTRPESQAIEYLETSYHVSWFPQAVPVWSETTYFAGITHQDILKKAALALGAGVSAIAYCPCVPNWIIEQNFLAEDKIDLDRWAANMCDASRHFQPIAILRTPAAGRGDRRPTQRVRDRQIFPLFSMAGLFAATVRQGHWRDTAEQPVLAVTGRSVWDFKLDSLGQRDLVLDGAALVENAPLNTQLSITGVEIAKDGEVLFSGTGYKKDGLLYTRGKVLVVPYIWQDVPASLMPSLLADIRRVLAPKLEAVVIEGDSYVLPVHYHHDSYDAILLVNLLHEPRQVHLALKSPRQDLLDPDGNSVASNLTMKPDEIRLLLAR
jgi:hypothetical protein